MEPADDELNRDESVLLLASVPERLADLTAGLDENQLRYRHAPAFPTLLELIMHLSLAGERVDSLLREVQIGRAERVDVRRAMDTPEEGGADSGGAQPPLSEILEDYARIRRRSIDLLRGIGPEDWVRTISDPGVGELSLVHVVRRITRHELGHLAQVRNLIAVLPEPKDLGPVADATTA
jgi:hypothetical protein